MRRKNKRTRWPARFVGEALRRNPGKQAYTAMARYGGAILRERAQQRKMLDNIQAGLEHVAETMRGPIPEDVLFGTIFLTPCWIEMKSGEIWADVLDKDRRGYFGKSVSFRVFSRAAYGKTWRCWATIRPTQEERDKAKWGEFDD